MHKSATKCNETLGKWCKNKHGASKIMDTLETYQRGFQSLKLFFSGQQRHHVNHSRVSVPQFAHFRPAAPLYYSIMEFLLSNLILAINPLIFAWNTVAIDQFGCRMSNTTELATLDGPVFASNALCWEKNLCLWHEALHWWTHRMPYNHWVWPDDSTRGVG
jgi:hypothetical protein